MCNHLEWLGWAWAPFGLLAIVFWLTRGPGPRAPLLFLLVAGMLTGVFGLAALSIDPTTSSGFPPWFAKILAAHEWILTLCMLGAPTMVGAALVLARGTRLFVVVAALAMLTALPVFSEFVGLALSCPQNF